MIPNIIILFNHTLTAAQEEDAYASLGVAEIILPPDEIRNLWSHVPPDLDSIKDYLSPVWDWISERAKSGDFVLVQGEFGATFLTVNFCMKKALLPIYSTTARKAIENHLDDGSVQTQHIFQHVRFRQYGR